MGFSDYEKAFMRSLLVPENKLESERDEYFTQKEIQFLKKQDLLRRCKDYGVFPLSFHKIHKTENVVLHKLFLDSFNFYDFLTELLSELTPPFCVLIDASFLIKKPITEEFRFVFGQRSTSFEIQRVINNDSDIDNVLSYFKHKSNSELLMESADNHRRQACFDESGFNPLKLVCAVLFMSKITSLNAPIPLE